MVRASLRSILSIFQIARNQKGKGVFVSQVNQRKRIIPIAGISPNELAERHLYLAAAVAREFQQRLPNHVSFDDLVGAGHVGLVEAAQRFNPTGGTSFSTFARHRVRGAIIDDLRRIDPVTRHIRSQQRAVEGVVAEITRAKQRPPTEAEIARRLKIRLGRWRQLNRVLYDAGCHVAGDHAVEHPLIPLEHVASGLPNPERLAATTELCAVVANAIQSLPPRERTVIYSRHFGGRTMAEIGAGLGVSESRISQIHAAALGKLRAYLTSCSSELRS